MANTREIKLRIKGINDTKKITKAMKMMAAVKLRKARANHNATKPFFEHIQETIVEILDRLPEINNGYFDKREKKEKKVIGYIVITSDRGLTGSYNHNVIKLAQGIIDKENSIVFPIGNMVKKAMITNGYKVDTNVGIDKYEIDMNTASKIAKRMIALFQEETIDELKLIYTDMKSAMTLKPEILNLLPLTKDDFKCKGDTNELLSLEPSPEIVFEVLANKYVNGILYGGMVESFASEQLARMNAMDSSTNNAEKMVKKLTLDYNRVRQATITQEISEIIGGTNASN